MEEKKAQKSKLFQIPIEEYEEDMNTESAKDKKKEILDLFANSNNLQSEEDFREIEQKLHYACREGNIELIKIYLSETIENNLLKFKIDRANQTASLFKVHDNIKNLIVPRTVKHESIDYLITSICGPCNTITSIKFVDDSAVRTIHARAFPYWSQIEEICFPASLRELEESWCQSTKHLIKIEVSPLNDQFVFREDKYLLGKSDKNSDDFDVLLFARRDIEDISIPPNIKAISSYAFSDCKRLTRVEIPPNSNLKTIEKYAFSYSQIEEIFFPASLIELKEDWCHAINKLRKIKISPSNTQFVFREDKYLLGKSDKNSDEFDVLLFARRDIKDISIPPNIKVISSYAFYDCQNLIKVEIPPNSNLQTIESSSFSSSKIEEIFIPSNVSKICQYAFSNCRNLRKVNIPQNSNLQTIEEGAFSFSKIEKIYLPASLKELKKEWCSDTILLNKIEISPSNTQFIFKEDKYLLGKSDNTSDEFDVLLFAVRDIEEASIPPNIKVISSYAFSSCKHLTQVEIPPNSNLQTIEEDAFSRSNIKKIYIPSKVSKICGNTFLFCQNLKKIEIPQNSNLQTIDECAFSFSKIKEIYFPASLKELKEGWCENMEHLIKIEVSPLNDQFVFKEDKYLLGKSDKNSDEFDVLLFARRDIKDISIPPNIKVISSYAFSDCKRLTRVEIPPHSNLHTIEKYAFSSSNIREIFIPSKVSKIYENTFQFCENLQIVEISDESELQSFSLAAFIGCENIVVMSPSNDITKKLSLIY